MSLSFPNFMLKKLLAQSIFSVSQFSPIPMGNDFIYGDYFRDSLIDHFLNIDYLTNYYIRSTIGSTFHISKSFSSSTTMIHVISFQNLIQSIWTVHLPVGRPQ